MDSTALAQPKVPATAWLRRAAIACGVLALMACPGALANDPVDDALSLVAQERHAEAREAIEDMMERNPEAPGVRLLQGVLYAREGNLVEAVTIFEDLRNDYPQMFEAHNNLAVLYAKLGRLDDARKALIAALELRPDAVIYANLGDVYMKLAEEAYQRAHELRVEQVAAAEEGGEADAASQPEAAPVETLEAEAAQEEEKAEALAAVPVEPEVVEVPESPEEPEIVEEPEVVEEPEEAVAQAPSENCVQAGWFGDRKIAHEAAALMRAHGAKALKVRSEEEQIVKNYQVYLPPAGSREAARALMRELRGRGVEDLWIIDRGAQINGVSLGVYRNKQYMSRRVAEVETLGYTVATRANMRTAAEYAVEAQAGGERAALDDAWKAAFPEQAIRTIDCADRS